MLPRANNTRVREAFATLIMERTRELLLGSSLSVKEIAGCLGFNNPDYFAKLFKRSTGATPNRYRGRKAPDPAAPRDSGRKASE